MLNMRGVRQIEYLQKYPSFAGQHHLRDRQIFFANRKFFCTQVIMILQSLTNPLVKTFSKIRIFNYKKIDFYIF